MTKLSVNINKVATLRNTRTIGIPSVTHAARLCLDAGATAQRFIRGPISGTSGRMTCTKSRALLKQYPRAEFNIEGNPLIDYMHFIEAVRPTQATLVPDEREAFTSNHGWDLRFNGERLAPLIRRLKDLGCRVSLFMDPVPDSMAIAKQLGADRVELYTEPYAAAFARGDDCAADAYAESARLAHAAGLEINAGHDLNLDNLPPFLRQVSHVAEVSIGHALIGDALEFGLAETVRKYLAACAGGAS